MTMEKKPETYKLVLILSIGVIAISIASIWIKKCTAPALVIAFYRLSIASVFYLGLSYTRVSTRLKRKRIPHKFLMILSGIFLALHFASWITSLRYTSVASSVVLVQTSPIFVALGSYLLLKERMNWRLFLGITITLCGALIIGTNDASLEGSQLLGNALAVVGALCAAGYLIIGRRVRSNMETITYVAIVYSAAAITILLLVWIKQHSLINFNAETFFYLIGIAIGPQIIGHTSQNWALKYLSATSVAVVALGEPIGATILAVFLLGEQPSLLKIAGAVIILAGVAFTLYAENQKKKSSHRCLYAKPG